MSSYQIPPPLANISFPPSDNNELQFNYIDSFVTTWVTPDGSKDPCFLTLYYWNSSTPDEPWTSRSNYTVSLNGTRIVPLNVITSNGLGELNLDYVDPVGGHKKVTGGSFQVNHDLSQPKAVTWNQKALSSSTKSSILAAATSTAITRTTTAASETSSTQAGNTLALAATSTPTALSNPAKSSSASHGAKVTSIVLGTILGIVFAAALFMFWIRRRRQKRIPKLDDCISTTVPIATDNATRVLHEKEAVVPVELGSGDRRCELDSGKR